MVGLHVKRLLLPCRKRADRVALEHAGDRVCGEDAERVVERAAGPGGTAGDERTGTDIPLLHEIGPERHDELAGRRLTGERPDNKIVFGPGHVGPGVSGRFLVGALLHSIKRAVGFGLFTFFYGVYKLLAGSNATRTAVLARGDPMPWGLVPPVNVVSLLERPDHAEVVLPPDLFLADTDGADPEGRRAPQRDGLRIADPGIFADRLEQVPEPCPLHGIRLDDVDLRDHAPDAFPEHLLFCLRDKVGLGDDRGIGKGDQGRHLERRVAPGDCGKHGNAERLRGVQVCTGGRARRSR